MSNKSLRLGLARRVLNESSEISLSARLVSHAGKVPVSLLPGTLPICLRSKYSVVMSQRCRRQGKVHLVVIAQL